ncbi:MAG TPA: cysteine desulfurase family protein [Bacillaceae bacterium]
MIYLDNSATTKPYDEVLQSFVKVNQEYYGNPSSLHNWGGKAEKLLSQAREQIAGLAGVKPGEIYFTSGGTEGNNLAIKGTALTYKGRGNHIVLSSVEHPSVSEACEQLRGLGFDISYVPVNEAGVVSAEDVEAAITEQTILVTIIHVNNEVGSMQPIKKIGKILRRFPKILFHVDHVQGAGKVPLDIHGSFIDLCTFSAHKFHGLKGTGFLYVREGLRLKPLLSGGGQERKLRSGTENTAGIVAMAKAFRMAEQKRREGADRMKEIRDELIGRLGAMQGIEVHTIPEYAAPHILNFSAGMKGEVMVHALEEEGIIISTTSACSSKEQTGSKTLKAMGIEDNISREAVRVSLSYENTRQDAEALIAAVQKTMIRLQNVMG